MKKLATTLLLFLQVIVFGQGEPELKTDGIVFPSLTTVERDASTPIHGQVIFNETEQTLQVFDLNGWKSLGAGGGGNMIIDADQDTKIELVENNDLDFINMTTEGQSRLAIWKNISNHTRIEIFDRGDNIAIGDDAGSLLNSTTGQNVMIGQTAGNQTTTGSKNIFIGYEAANKNEEGKCNIAIGHEALLNNVTADDNIAIGKDALKSIDIDQETTTFGSKNVGIGTAALVWANRFTTGSTAIGYGAGAVGGTLSGSVFLGHKAGQIIDANYDLNNALFIANDEGVPLIFGEFDNKFISIDGKLGIGKNNPAFNAVIKQDNNALSGDNVDISNLALIIERGSNTAGQAAGIGFQSSSSETTIGGAMIFERSGSDSKGHLHFATKSGSGQDTDIPIRMTIEDIGNVGIGKTDPDAKLDIDGDLIIRPSISSGGCNTVEDRGRLWFNDADGVLNLCTDALTPGNPSWVNLNFGL